MGVGGSSQTLLPCPCSAPAVPGGCPAGGRAPTADPWAPAALALSPTTPAGPGRDQVQGCRGFSARCRVFYCARRCEELSAALEGNCCLTQRQRVPAGSAALPAGLSLGGGFSGGMRPPKNTRAFPSRPGLSRVWFLGCSGRSQLAAGHGQDGNASLPILILL